MALSGTRVKVAAVQAAPVVLDREATLDKLERLVAEAADLDLGLVTEGRQLLDVNGHYSRPDTMWLETSTPRSR